MKAMVRDRNGSPDILRLEDVNMPVIGPDDVLVRVHAAGVDQGVWHIVTGLPYRVRVAGYGVRRPKSRVAGMDIAGTVEAVGANVTRFKPGDEVFGTSDGSLAEYARASQDAVVRKPARLTFEQAAAVPVSACAALQGLRDRGEITEGQRVLVIGAGGGVGTFAVQLAKVFGAHVTGVCSTAKVDLVRSLGADDVVDYTREDFAARSRRYDLILDTAGNRPLSRLRRALTPEGTLVIIGAEVGGRWLGGVDRQLRAALLSPFVGQRLRILLSKEGPADLELLGEMIKAGTVTPVVDRTFPLSEVPEAIRYLRDGKARGKVVITV
ncbi:MAG: NAD(P)-dependent alcohol dehydrogenase [Jiangellaceae bacterium]